jgi:hypothetical protein
MCCDRKPNNSNFSSGAVAPLTPPQAGNNRIIVKTSGLFALYTRDVIEYVFIYILLLLLLFYYLSLLNGQTPGKPQPLLPCLASVVAHLLFAGLADRRQSAPPPAASGTSPIVRRHARFMASRPRLLVWKYLTA